MTASKDFRAFPFDAGRITRSGKSLGRQTYWKLYAIENIFRVLIHSVLSAQIKPDWWTYAVDATIQDKAKRFKVSYTKKSWHGKPGLHDIYYLDLKDLNEIIRANAHLFDPVVPSLDRWMVLIEDLRLPRNVVAHMNFPTATDISRIDVCFNDCSTLLPLVQKKIALIIP